MDEHVEKYIVHDNASLLDKRMHRIEVSRLVKKLVLEGPVLDMGFGHGVVVEELLEKAMECAVVEQSAELVAKAKKDFGSQLEVHHSSFEDFSPQKKFGAVFATAVLHHVADPVRTLERVSTWMKPGGKIIVTVPNAESIHRAVAVATGLEHSLSSVSHTGKQMGVVRTFTSSHLTEILQRTDFSNIQQHPSFLKFLPYSEMSEFTTPQLESLFELAHLAPIGLHASIVFEATFNPKR